MNNLSAINMNLYALADRLKDDQFILEALETQTAELLENKYNMKIDDILMDLIIVNKNNKDDDKNDHCYLMSFLFMFYYLIWSRLASVHIREQLECLGLSVSPELGKEIYLNNEKTMKDFENFIKNKVLTGDHIMTQV